MTDTEPKKYQEWILETIDSLRSRKARPDLERICRMVRRRYGSDPDRTRAELEKLIQSQTVLKVSYKGSISYRNAAKVLRRSKKMSELAASRGESRSKPEHLNNSADSAQSCTGQDTEEASLGPGKPELPPHLFHNSGCNCETPGCAAPEELEASALSSKRGFGQQQEGCRQQSHVGDTHSVSSAAEPSGEVQLRVVNFLNNKTCSIVSQSQTRSKLCTASSAQGDNRVASVRSLSAASTGHMKPLGRKGTIGCLSHQERLSCEEKLSRSKVQGLADRDVARARLRWTRCGNGTLGAALEPSDGGKQLQKNDPTLTTGDDEKWKEADKQTEQDSPQICDELSEPPVAMTTDPEAEDAEMQDSPQRWTRGKLCTESLSAAIPEQSCGDPEIDEASCLLTSTASPTDSGLDEPDSFGTLSPIDWSVSDVVSYFSAAGFPEQAAAFRTQEIDGKALLLMQRNDVLTGLSIKLGPALKIYEHHVKALQKTHFDEDEL